MTRAAVSWSDWTAAAVGALAVVGALWFVPAAPGPGPLGLVTALACLHLAWFAPAVAGAGASGVWAAAAVLVPAWAVAGFGHAVPARAWALALIASAALCGWAGRRAPRHAFLASVALLFALPFFLGHLVEQFGDVGAAADWETISPWLAAQRIAVVGAPVAALLGLLAWPVFVLARRRPA